MLNTVSGLMTSSSGDGVAHESGGANGGSSEVGASSAVRGGGVEESERIGGGGNRWPKHETLALLKIRFDMDVAFRDSNFKGPLWEEVSRKMTELGFQRSGKKCREKFENVNKYHKRTKDGRESNTIGKTYRFFDQLQAWESTRLPVLSFSCTQPRPPPAVTTMPEAPMQTNAVTFPIQSHVGTVSSISPDPLNIVHPNNSMNAIILPPPLHAMNTSNHPQIQLFKTLNCLGNSASLLTNPTSSSTSSDEGIKRQRGKKRKWKDFFESLIKNVFEKQEELHKKFLDSLDKRERDQMAREEEWRNQEMERTNREHELLVQERSISAAKDTAVVAFLQKLTEQLNLGITKSSKAPPLQEKVPAPEITQPPQQTPASPPQRSTLQPPTVVTATPEKFLNTRKTDVFGDCINLTSSLRWPKAEVEALINLRTSLDLKYQENVPKGSLWEDISAAMGKLGYNRSSKRCKEKWENINKYFKKAKESNKKRTEDSKTCPYFHRLDNLHKKRAKRTDIPPSNNEHLVKSNNPIVPIVARPEQPWSVLEQQQQDSTLHDRDQDEEIENMDHEEEEDGGGDEIVANKQQSSMG
ncbi:trihelix transcription factor DF1-like [Primulina tabacum]|uniref:trihelix transcription factor DF1-like n=1 Tax=Primulina tabacum TaxID=48773 RepID=UPI003F59505B